MNILHSILGIMAIFFIAFLLSSHKKNINFRTVGFAFLIQVLFAMFILYIPVGKDILRGMSDGVTIALAAGFKGLTFVFGPLAEANPGFIFAISVLGTIVFFSSLVSVLYFIKIMPLIINTVGYGLHKLLKTSRAESLNATANIFVGMTEAPLVVKPFVKRMSQSEIFAVMVSGLCSISGGVLAGYVNIGVSAEYLIASAFMSAPAGLLMAKIIMPETESTTSDLKLLDKDSLDDDEIKPANVIEAAANGASTGMHLALNVGAMLIAFIGLMALINSILSGLGGLIDLPNLSLELILGYIFAPLAFITGVSWNEAITFGSLLGTKIVVNEFVAFIDFLKPEVYSTLSDTTKVIVTFSLCGFSNIGSIGILIGGLGLIAPNKKSTIARLAVKALLAANLADLMSATLAGLLVSL